MMNNLSLLDTEDDTAIEDTDVIELSMEEKVELSVSAIKEQLAQGKNLFVMVSFGKDSAVMLALTLRAVEEAIKENIEFPTVFILNSNTGLENPLVNLYVQEEIRVLKQYLIEKNLPVKFRMGMPNQSNSFLANMIGGRNTASMPGMSRKCQQQLKKAPLDKLKREIRKEAAKEQGVKKIEEEMCLNLIGLRHDESSLRSNLMKKRNESYVTPALIDVGGTQNYVLSPLADFTTMDVFSFIGKVTNQKIKTYSTFEALVETYRDSELGECMVTVYLSKGSQSSGSNNSCGQNRHGCHTCTASNADGSMERMLADEKNRFEWMRPLNNIRNYIVDSHWDLSKRSWLSRSVDMETGHIKLAPNTYSPNFCLELLQYYMSADADELAINPYSPRFTTLPIEDIFYITLLWCRYGYFNGLKPLEVYKDIYIDGNRYYPTKIKNPVPRGPIPASISIPFCDSQYDNFMNGFRDTNAAIAEAESTITKSGKIFYSPNSSAELTIDAEGAAMFLDYELDYILEKHKEFNSCPTSGIFTLMRYGFIQINVGGHSEWDRMTKIANQHKRHGITPEDKTNPVILKQKIFKSLGIQNDKLIPVTNVDTNREDIKMFDFYDELKDLTVWESDKRRNPVYKESQLELSL